MNHKNNSSLAQVLLLGTYHFAPSGGDGVNFDAPDVLDSQKQKEINEVLEKLAAFKPTKVAIEFPPSLGEKYNKLYSDYCSNKYTLGYNEVEQLAFRLGAQFNHPKIYPIDVQLSLPYDEFINYAEKHVPDFYNRKLEQDNKLKEDIDNMLKTKTVCDMLKYLNSEEWNTFNQGSYIDSISIGAGDTYVGANYVKTWYDRNIGIFANLQTISEPGDRIVVLYGAGHVSILREFISSATNMEFIDPLQYL